MKDPRDGIVAHSLLNPDAPGSPREWEASVHEGSASVVEADRRRKGWNEASKELAASGDDALVLPEFADDADAKLQW